MAHRTVPCLYSFGSTSPFGCRKVFSNLSSLHDLGLHANDLRHVPHHALAAVSRTLRTLDLGENAIKEASGLGGLRALNGLRLAGNDLTKLGAKAFVGAEKIRMLNLADNRIKEIDQDAFSPLKKLKVSTLTCWYTSDRLGGWGWGWRMTDFPCYQE